jgi:hypothetical protein
LTAQTIAEAVGLFINDTIACLDAPADFRPNDSLRRNATALLPHVTMSHKPLHRHSSSEKWCWAGRRCQARPGRNVGQHPAAIAYCLALKEH